MSSKHKKQFGVWMDAKLATITGRADTEAGEFKVVGLVKNTSGAKAPNENAANRQKYFKDIANRMPNIDEIHITGTGQVQEQFMKFLAESPQYKNAVSSESTSNKMNDEQLISYFTKHFS